MYRERDIEREREREIYTQCTWRTLNSFGGSPRLKIHQGGGGAVDGCSGT